MTARERILYAAMAFVAVLLFGLMQSSATQYRTNPDESGRSTRACVFASGAATTIDCSAAASASSSVLTANTRYVLSCTDDSYVRFGSSAPTAAAGDMILSNGAWLEFMTNDSIKYVACKNVSVDKACYYLECM